MNILKEDTIAAISTPLGSAGIGKIRISGPQALQVGNKIFKSIKNKNLLKAKTYTAHYGHVINPETGKIADEVICIVMKGPNSFTGEDIVEFDCHGGTIPLQRVLEIIIRNGASLAEPGEFSKRAFLNGRIDMAQAEGIIEVINSKTEKALDIALNHLNGKLSDRLENLKNQVIMLLAHLEAAIDYPEDEIEGFNSKELKDKFYKVREEIDFLLSTSDQGKIYKEGIKTVIVGKPNVGKSSLLNTLLEEKRAIVTDIPGTTRDIIEEYISIKGIPLKIIDTAGIRETEDLVEKIGVERARDSLKKADLVLMMLDVNQGVSAADLKIYQLVKNKPVILIINKIDLNENFNEDTLKLNFKEHIVLKISLKEEIGLTKLKEAIIEEVTKGNFRSDEEILITRTRHKNALEKSKEAINKVIESYQINMPYDFLTIDLKDCLANLGEITGETLNEDIINRIFNDFCLGK